MPDDRPCIAITGDKIALQPLLEFCPYLQHVTQNAVENDGHILKICETGAEIHSILDLDGQLAIPESYIGLVATPWSLGYVEVSKFFPDTAYHNSLCQEGVVAVFTLSPCLKFRCLGILENGQHKAVPSHLNRPFDSIAFFLRRVLPRHLSAASIVFAPQGPQLRSLSTSELTVIPPSALTQWLQYHINAALSSMIAGSCVVLVCGGCQKSTILRLKEIGLKVVLIDFDPDCPGSQLAQTFIHLTTEKTPRLFDVAAKEAKQQLAQLGIKVDGVLTFWEFATPLAAMIAGELSLPGNPFESVSCCRNKVRTCKQLSAIKKTVAYVPRFTVLTSVSDLCSMPEAWFPIVLKYSTGSEAVGVATARNMAEAVDQYRSTITSLKTAAAPEVGVEYGIQMMAVEQLAGAEVDVDIALFNGKVVCAVVSDNGPVLQPSCQEMTYVTPSRLDRVVQEALVNATTECISALGLTSGVFNVEWFLTEAGPKLIEINARPGGGHVPSALLSKHGFDIILTHALVSLGIEPKILAIRPNGVFHAVIIYHSRHTGRVDYDLLKTLSESDDRIAAEFVAKPSEGDTIEKQFGFISIQGRNENEARKVMREVLGKIGVDVEDYGFVA